MNASLLIMDVDDSSKVWKTTVEPFRDVSLSFEKNNATYSIFKPKTLDKDNKFFSTHTDGTVRSWEYNNGQAKCVRTYPCKLFLLN